MAATVMLLPRNTLKKRVYAKVMNCCATAWLCFFLAVPAAGAVTYYVDSAGGNDSNAGTSQATAWKNLSKVNGKTFLPGDTVLFKAGGNWTGQLHPKGSGATNSPIVLDQYGTGSKPIINANGATGNGAVYLYNQEYWEIGNLEIINDATAAGDRRGVYLAADNFGTAHHLYVRNCYIHNIKGIVDQISSAAKRTAGVLIETVSDSTTPTRFDDVLIENCVISTVDNEGIVINNKVSVGDYPGTPAWEARKITRLVVRGNSINDVAKNAMIIRLADETCLVEHNVCWDTAYRALTGNTIFSRSCRGTVFQYNEGYLNRTTDFDGSLYDADIQSPGCVFQYSYSHDNNHGLYWQCTDAADTNVIVRYNISQNDKGIIFCMNYDCQSTYVYNNTVYVGTNVSPTIIDERRKGTKSYWFYNNIFYNLSPTASYQWFNGVRTFDYNVFYGLHPSGEPSDPHKLTSNPRLVAPGSGGTGWNTVDGYKLQTGSPCIDSGKVVANNGGHDYWGDTVPFNGVPDRGADEYSTSNTNQPPSISIPPQSQFVMPGVTVTFTVTAAGTAPLAYQWRKSSAPLSGATTNGLALASVSTNDAGSYDVVVTNTFGSVTSAVATLALRNLTNSLTPSSRATIRNGDNNTNIDEQTLGYVMVKHNTNLTAAKGYFEFNLTGQNVNPGLPATLTLVRFTPSGPQHLQLWALNQPYPGMNNDITWDVAQANDTAGNSMLTNGSFAASPLAEAVVTASNAGTNTLTIPAPWGQYILSNKLVLALTGVDDSINTTTGFRVLVTNAAQLPMLTFSVFEGAPPTATTQPASGTTVTSALLNGAVNPGSLDTDWHFEYGPTTNYGSYSATNTLAAGTNTVAVSGAVLSLLAAAFYHYRVVASNSVGVASGQDMSFSTLPLPPPLLGSPATLENGAFQFVFDNPYDADFTVLATSNLVTPTAAWETIGAPAPIGDGLYQFVDPAATNYRQRFYLLRSP
jgi:hypothetical protein